jgi:hypothetical protein
MTDPSLPPGTTHADIDDHYAPPETQVASGAVDVGVDVEVNSHMDDAEIRAALAEAVRDALDMDDDRIVEVHGVTIGEVFKK